MCKEKLIRLPLVAKMLQKMYCGYSTCRICGLPWPVCGMESIDINEYLGVFYVCPHCFKTKPLEEIIQATKSGYYSQLYGIKDISLRNDFLMSHDINTIIERTKEKYKLMFNGIKL